MKNKGVFILGGGIMQLPALRIAQDMGLCVALADAKAECEGKSYADFFYQADLKNLDALAGAARDFQGKYSLDGVFTAGTDFSYAVAFLAEKFNLPGTSYESALNATDKFRMRRCFQQAGLPCPGFISLNDEAKQEDITLKTEKLSLPLVVKPVDNMGARGICLVEKRAQLAGAVRKALNFSRSRTVIIEEYLDGPEFSLDALLWEDDFQLCGIGERQICFKPFFVEMGHSIPARISVSEQEELLRGFQQGVKALGLSYGAAKGDIKLIEGRAHIVEIAGRLSGGYMSGWTWPLASGMDPTRAALQLCLGEKPLDLKEKWHKTSAERALISIPGKVRSIEGLDELRETQPEIKEIFLRIKKGEELVFPTNNVEKCGNIISCAENREEAFSAANLALSRIFIDLEKDNAETMDFLFKKKDFPGPAFVNAGEKALPEINELPYERDFCPEKGFSPSAKLAEYVILNCNITEWGPDWQAVPAGFVLEWILKRSALKIAENSTGSFLGRGFWTSFFYGSRQGAWWFLRNICLDGDEI